MTLKEAVLKSLEELNKPSTYLEVYNHIIDRKYFDFGVSKTPYLSVSGILTVLFKKVIRGLNESNKTVELIPIT